MIQHLSTSQRLHNQLEDIIESTEPGARLPAEPKLARQLGVSRATLREAMRTFETQGLLHRRQGAGTFVLHPSHVIESGLEVLESIETLAERIDLSVSVSDMKVEQRLPDPEEASALDLSSDSKVIDLSRVIIAEGRPVAYLVDIVPDDIFDLEDFGEEFSGSVLDMILKRGELHLASSRCEINSVTATTDLARSLGIQRGDVLLGFKAFLYDTAGRVVDYSFSYFLPGYFRFHVNRRVG